MKWIIGAAIAAQLAGCMSTFPPTGPMLKVDTQRICDFYRQSHRQEYLDELYNRGAFDTFARRAVKYHEIYIGMSADAVRCSWGTGFAAHTSLFADSMTEEWIYPKPAYVYFKDGAVTGVQN